MEFHGKGPKLPVRDMLAVLLMARRSKVKGVNIANSACCETYRYYKYRMLPQALENLAG